MRLTAALSCIGAGVGGVVAVLVHYLTHRQPYGSGYYALNQFETGTFLVHPHWWPLTAVCLGAGFICGLMVAAGFLLLGRRLRVVAV